jgi:hypothetical protein
VQGAELPEVETKVFLSLEIGGLPNVRLAATVVRRLQSRRHNSGALRFDLPAERIDGLARLLEQHVRRDHGHLSAMVVDSDARSRDRIADALAMRCEQVFAFARATDAVAKARDAQIDLLLARADAEGLAALAAIARESSQTFRVAFGRGQPLQTAFALGFAEAVADDPASAKSLREWLDRHRLLRS